MRAAWRLRTARRRGVECGRGVSAGCYGLAAIPAVGAAVAVLVLTLEVATRPGASLPVELLAMLMTVMARQRSWRCQTPTPTILQNRLCASRILCVPILMGVMAFVIAVMRIEKMP